MRDPERMTWVEDYRIRRSDGTEMHIRDRARFRRRSDGRAWRLVGGMTDITDLVAAEHRMLASQRLEAVGQLTGGLAHDFNNLLTVVLGNADRLIVELPDDADDLVELAEMVRAAALRGAELSRQLLAFARRQPLEPQATDVATFIGHLVRLLRRTIPEHTQLDVVTDEAVPPAFVDRGQLESAIVNLCLNARDSMPDGGRLLIETAVVPEVPERPAGGPSAAPGPWVEISVADTGSGIDPGIVDRVIEPFFTTKTEGAGSGLGLSMVHGFVTQSGGHLRLDSRAGVGTIVRIYLPIADDTATDESGVDAPPPTLAPADGAEVMGAGEHILVVEDDQLVRQLAVRQLTAAGYTVVEADSGPAALAVLQSHDRIDLLFTDVVMPGGMDGRALAEAAAERRPTMPVLYTSGYSRDAIVRDGRVEPGVELLVKPYRATELTQRVRQLLDSVDTRPPLAPTSSP